MSTYAGDTGDLEGGREGGGPKGGENGQNFAIFPSTHLHFSLSDGLFVELRPGVAAMATQFERLGFSWLIVSERNFLVCFGESGAWGTAVEGTQKRKTNDTEQPHSLKPHTQTQLTPTPHTHHNKTTQQIVGRSHNFAKIVKTCGFSLKNAVGFFSPKFKNWSKSKWPRFEHEIYLCVRRAVFSTRWWLPCQSGPDIPVRCFNAPKNGTQCTRIPRWLGRIVAH